MWDPWEMSKNIEEEPLRVWLTYSSEAWKHPKNISKDLPQELVEMHANSIQC